MKYIIDLPEEIAKASEEYWKKSTGMTLEPCSNLENEVWKFVGTISGLVCDEYCKCFDIEDIDDETVYHKYTYQEAKAKYEAWRKENEVIRVGDEVIPLDTQYDTMVVTKLWTSEHCDEWVDTVASDGRTYNFLKTSIKKTGRHFDEVEELLDKMRGGEE